jgi:hypothetical protein
MLKHRQKQRYQTWIGTHIHMVFSSKLLRKARSVEKVFACSIFEGKLIDHCAAQHYHQSSKFFREEKGKTSGKVLISRSGAERKTNTNEINHCLPIENHQVCILNGENKNH